jgi:hypothetical protein
MDEDRGVVLSCGPLSIETDDLLANMGKELLAVDSLFPIKSIIGAPIHKLSSARRHQVGDGMSSHAHQLTQNVSRKTPKMFSFLFIYGHAFQKS